MSIIVNNAYQQRNLSTNPLQRFYENVGVVASVCRVGFGTSTALASGRTGQLRIQSQHRQHQSSRSWRIHQAVGVSLLSCAPTELKTLWLFCCEKMTLTSILIRNS